MRTFVRVCAFLVVLGIGLLSLVVGLMAIVAGSQATQPLPGLGAAAVQVEKEPEAETAPAVETEEITVKWGQTVSAFGGALYLSVLSWAKQGYRPMAAQVIVGCRGGPGEQQEYMLVGDTVQVRGQRLFEIQLMEFANDGSVALDRDSRGITRFRVSAYPPDTGQGQQRAAAVGAGPPDEALLGGGLIAAVCGLALVVCAIVLLAVPARAAVQPAAYQTARGAPASLAMPPASGASVTHARPQTGGNVLLILGIALVAIGLLIAIVGVSQHNPYMRASRFGTYAGGEAGAIIAAGVVVLVVGAGMGIAGYFSRRRRESDV